MTAHNIACQKCMLKADFYVDEDNILDNVDLTRVFKKVKYGEEKLKFKVVTVCPNCDEIYVLDGSL